MTIYKGDNKKEIKAVIRRLAASQGVTMAALASRLGLSPQAFDNRFRRGVLSLDELARVAAAIGYDIDIQLIPKEEAKTEDK